MTETLSLFITFSQSILITIVLSINKRGLCERRLLSTHMSVAMLHNSTPLNLKS